MQFYAGHAARKPDEKGDVACMGLQKWVLKFETSNVLKKIVGNHEFIGIWANPEIRSELS